MEEIRDCLGRLACCGNAATGYVSSLYKGHRTTAYAPDSANPDSALGKCRAA